MNSPVVSFSGEQLSALIGWEFTKEEWQTFWNIWSSRKILLAYWLRREPIYALQWFDSALRLEMSYRPGTLTSAEVWALRSVSWTYQSRSTQPLNWGRYIDEQSCDLAHLEHCWNCRAHRYKDAALFFINRPDGVDVAVQLDWWKGWSGGLRAISAAALGVPKVRFS